MTTRSQRRRKAVEELISVDQETPVSENHQSENPVVGTSKSPKVRTENLEEKKSTHKKEILSDITKILAENQKEILELIALVAKKRATMTDPEESDSESENVLSSITSTPVKSKATATTLTTTPLNSRNMVTGVLNDSTNPGKKRAHIGHKVCRPTTVPQHRDYCSHRNHPTCPLCQRRSQHPYQCSMVSPKISKFSKT